MKETLIALISASVTFAGIWLKGRLEKPKIQAEVSNQKIGGEKTIYEMSREFGFDMEARLTKLQEKFEVLSEKFEVLRREKETLAIETKEKDKKIAELEERIDILEAEVEKYKAMGATIKETAHHVVDEIASKMITQ